MTKIRKHHKSQIKRSAIAAAKEVVNIAAPGSMAAFNIFEAWVGPNFNKNRSNFYASILEELGTAAQKKDAPESFVTVLAMATPYVDRTRVESKISAYKNIAVFTFNNPEVEEYKIQLVIRIIDQISDQHLRLLELLKHVNPNRMATDYIEVKREVEIIRSVNQVPLIEFIHGMMGEGSDIEFANLVASDFKSLNLISTAKMFDGDTFNGLTSLGQQVIKMVNNN